jgi:hemerythrin superfamily protein
LAALAWDCEECQPGAAGIDTRHPGGTCVALQRMVPYPAREERMKATQLLKKDHTTVKKLLTDFGRTTNRAVKRREQMLDEIAKELEVHSTIEEEIFYPAVKSIPEGASLVSEAKDEHEQVDGLVAEAQGMEMGSDEVTRKVAEIKKAVLHHATEEEQEMFPLAERHLGGELDDLGAKLQARKTELTGSRLHRAKRAVKKAVRRAA